MARSVAEIQVDLDAAYTARRMALTGQEYSLDTGQGRQSVKRANLKDISEMISGLQAELEDAQAESVGLITGSFQRHG